MVVRVWGGVGIGMEVCGRRAGTGGGKGGRAVIDACSCGREALVCAPVLSLILADGVLPAHDVQCVQGKLVLELLA